jgi:hypothetical protein
MLIKPKPKKFWAHQPQFPAATSPYLLRDTFSRYADNTVMAGQVPLVGPAWSTTGDSLPTTKSGKLTNTGLGYLYTKLASSPQALGVKLTFSGAGDTSEQNYAMAWSSQASSNLVIQSLLHPNFGPEEYTLGVFDSSGNFSILQAVAWSQQMQLGTEYEVYCGYIGSTFVMVGPFGEVFACSDPTIAANAGLFPKSMR